MEYSTLPLIYIDSKIKGLVKINESPTGETGETPIITPYSGTRGFIISFAPLENIEGKLYLPFSRKIEISTDEVIFKEDGLVKHCKWPENIYSFELYPAYIEYAGYSTTFASVIEDFDFYVGGVPHCAFVYEEMSYYIGIENSSSKRLVFAGNIDFTIRNADITLYKYHDNPFLMITGETKTSEDYIIVIGLKPHFEIHLSKACKKVSVKGNIIETEESLVDEVFVTKEYTIKTNGVEKEKRVRFNENLKKDKSSIVACFFEMVKAKDSECMELLSASLKSETSFNDILEYFGDFYDFEKPLSNLDLKENMMALKYAETENKQVARVFAFDIRKQRDENFKIDNIYEP